MTRREFKNPVIKALEIKIQNQVEDHTDSIQTPFTPAEEKKSGLLKKISHGSSPQKSPGLLDFGSKGSFDLNDRVMNA